MPYGDILEKKYQFDPIPEEIPTPVVAPAPVEQAVVQEETIPEAVVEEEIPEVEMESGPELDQIEDISATKFQTDVQKKFGELFFTTKKIYEIKDTL